MNQSNADLDWEDQSNLLFDHVVQAVSKHRKLIEHSKLKWQKKCKQTKLLAPERVKVTKQGRCFQTKHLSQEKNKFYLKSFFSYHDKKSNFPQIQVRKY